MKLYAFPVAPNPTRVRLYLAEKRGAGAVLPVEEVVVDLREGQQRSPEHLARNPQGKLPVLEVEAGRYLTESLPIVLYLEELFPEPPMIGRTPLERAETLNVERIVDLSILLPIGRIVHATRSPLGRPPNPAIAEAFRAGLPGACRLLDERLSDGRPFLMGDQPTIADCTLAAGLQFGRFGEVEIPREFTHLGRWDAAFRERPSAREVLLV